MSGSPYLSLQRTEAIDRRGLLDVTSYDVSLDLATDESTFASQTTIRFRSRGGATFVDLKPVSIRSITLNGDRVDPDLLRQGRVPLETVAGDNELVVDAVMRFRNDGEGLHRSVDPADGRHYVYGMSFMDAAPSVFACFDQPDLKAPYRLAVRAPEDWVVVANAPGEQVEPGSWVFAETPPLSTYFVTVVAGPYHLVTDEHDGIPLGLSARASLARELDADADELFTLTRQGFDEMHRLFGIRYPFGSYHQAFVPEFNAGAMENPGCVTFRDPLIFTTKVTRGARIVRATTVAHEMAHQWFGNLTTPVWWDDLWLNESFAEYMGTRVTADVTQYDDAWVHNSYKRRQWGLLADAGPATHPVAGNGAVDATAALQDFDGISYVKGSTLLKQLNGRLGDDVFFRGVIDHFETHRFGNATMHDLFASWERAGAGDLSDFTDGWLRTRGVDTVAHDREAGVLRRTPPAVEPVERTHALTVAVTPAGGGTRRVPMTLDSEATALEAGEDDAVVIDVDENSWLVARPDATTISLLPSVIRSSRDPMERSAVWNNLRSAFEVGGATAEDVLAVAVVAIPDETSDEPLSFNGWASSPSTMLLMEWLLTKVAPLANDPRAALESLHQACLARATTAEARSTVQLAAFQGAVASCRSTDELERWLDGHVPDGVEVDLGLRWRLLVRLAALGGTDRRTLDRFLADEPTATSRVDHARAVASMPDDESKAWAWARFTGVEDVPNYELQATGQGMWLPDQEHLTTPYVDRFFADLPATPSHRTGWVLADAACWFFPITSRDPETVHRAARLADDGTLDLSLRRQLRVMADELQRRQDARRVSA
ncbi:aminopeptidase N [Nocardioides sp. Soil805]|uniref:aminopeptidase N n=1 Tax=Nocardioides sp. Soil805 TaxID=1736416 RepID=UPI000702ACF8|nr:aminopeptidase N [Nocardioides sp. Soil805]KRF32386.1 aminopeptidase N [Nocardioides sp. Soil805]